MNRSWWPPILVAGAILMVSCGPRVQRIDSSAAPPSPVPGAQSVSALCEGFLAVETTSPKTGSDTASLDHLGDLLGADSPQGVLAALETLATPGVESFAMVEALDSLGSHVKPRCRSLWRESVRSAASPRAAAEAFVSALASGDHEALTLLAAKNVVAHFEDIGANVLASSELGPVGATTFSVAMTPTSAVMCRLVDNFVDDCTPVS